MRNFFI